MSEILEQWRAGQGLPSVLVIDGHTHIHRTSFGDLDEMADRVVAIMDSNGVAAACLLSVWYMTSSCD